MGRGSHVCRNCGEVCVRQQAGHLTLWVCCCTRVIYADPTPSELAILTANERVSLDRCGDDDPQAEIAIRARLFRHRQMVDSSSAGVMYERAVSPVRARR